MAAHADHSTHAAGPERIKLDDSVRPLFKYARYTFGGAFLLSLLLSVIFGWGSGAGLKRFYFSYLTAFVFVLSIALSALAFLLIQHVVRAGWSVVVRRLMENIAGIIPTLGLLSLPIVASALFYKGDLYRWALPLSAAEHSTHGGHAAPGGAGAHGAVGDAGAPALTLAKAAGEHYEGDGHAHGTHGHTDKAKPPVLTELALKKRAWLNPPFFALRILLYFGIWSFIAIWYRNQSLLQDQTGDVQYTHNMQRWAPLATIFCALTVTLASFDLIMSLDPHWYSTIFGVYYFAGGTIAFWSTLVILVWLLQKKGYLTQSINVEHRHDLGKFMFGFVFFWGYIAFSQYMLLWYANIPEETEYLERHGLTTSKAAITGWSYIGIILLFGKLLIPFAGLLSRHVKRNEKALLFWAVWMLVFHYLDCYWMVMPEMQVGFRPHIVDLTALIAVLAAAVGAFIQVSLRGRLLATADPRMPEALAFHNI